MKLNPDCVRDILLAVEEATDGTKIFEYDKRTYVPDNLKKYDHNEILYHFRQCKMSDLIIGFQTYDCGDFVVISDLSPEGHEFLANIRQDNIWNKTRKISNEIGSGSLSTLIQIAINVVSDLVKSHFGIT